MRYRQRITSRSALLDVPRSQLCELYGLVRYYRSICPTDGDVSFAVLSAGATPPNGPLWLTRPTRSRSLCLHYRQDLPRASTLAKLFPIASSSWGIARGLNIIVPVKVPVQASLTLSSHRPGRCRSHFPGNQMPTSRPWYSASTIGDCQVIVVLPCDAWPAFDAVNLWRAHSS